MRMKRWLLLLSLFVSLAGAQTSIPLMDSVVFYDGYAKNVAVAPSPDGAIKLRNDLYARKLTDAERAQMGNRLRLRVVVQALCDNYDRLAGVNLALVPKGLENYQPDSVPHLELGRFITPFMSKNVQPDTVSYVFDIDNVASLLRDVELNKRYDLWVELSVFGIPYAAQKQVAGCSERNDVFRGQLELITDSVPLAPSVNVLIPLFFKHAFNNYTVGATDTLGLTTKSVTFYLPKSLSKASFYLITSNHGANEGGEEYIRRDHFVYVDGKLRCRYKPGRASCEPFRARNTQRNGIYGKEPHTDEEWQSFSNWCPGDVIDIHRIDLGVVSAGNHTFMIQVPSAMFEGKQGDFPLSLYFQGND